MSVQQAETAKARAERFVRDVLQDDDHADAIADESLEEWAARKKVRIVENPRCLSPHIIERGATMPSKAELEERISQLEAENDELQDQLDQVADIVAPPEEEDEGEEDENDSGEE